jgi:4'-phosphopantetheinyl transferase
LDSSDIRWKSSAEFVEPRRGEVQVWRAFLDVLPSYLESLRPILCATERERAVRFHFERDRSRFIAARAFLRILMGYYLRKTPSAIRFGYGPQGKPFLVGEETGDLRFNVSHSQGLALYAVTLGAEVGVDLEYSRKNMSIEEISRRFFSAQEIAALESLPQDQRQRAFLVCWTRKEAYIKARGEGLSVALDSFSVTMKPDEPPAIMVHDEPQETSRWSVLEVDPDPQYVAAVAVEDRNPFLRCLEFPSTVPGSTPSIQTIQPHLPGARRHIF